ncbi:hypothetical protein DUI87_21567 [Hirundo rustica rustica]|uniref:Reverse transcriptase domain-containing protein n=1 Tax=Hirundo rustica rustica TaxID=333673 RepID=A0A3M0K5P1_HIRRU|nr:hypothetical protein DUI87_21567 [Hirundo rustica rustica]
MDDVLMCAPNDDLLSHALDLTINSLVAAGFKLQEDKIQRMPPWKHLCLKIGKRTIVLQKLAVKNNIKVLADVQQLCGSLNWEQLSPPPLGGASPNGMMECVMSLVGPNGPSSDVPVEDGGVVKEIHSSQADCKTLLEIPMACVKPVQLQ